MSDYGHICLTGSSRSTLQVEVLKLKAWGGDMPVWVSAGGAKNTLTPISEVEAAINGNLAEYIEKNFGSQKTILKSGGNDELYLVPDDSVLDTKNRRYKIRRNSKFTPKKKKRK
jgi:hypothetical protein